MELGVVKEKGGQEKRQMGGWTILLPYEGGAVHLKVGFGIY